MYTGNNSIAVRSQEWITESLFILLKQKAFEKVTITDICAKAGVSRQTFYKLFDDKEEIIQFYLQSVIYIPNEYFIFLQHNKLKLLDFYFMTLEQEKERFTAIFDNRLERLLFQKIKEQFSYIHTHFEFQQKEIPFPIFSDFFCYSLIGITLSWLQDTSTLSLDEVIAISNKLFGNNYQ